MSVNLVQNGDGSLSLIGKGGVSGGFCIVDQIYGAASVDMTIFVASRDFVVRAVSMRIDAAGTDAGAVTAVVKKAASGTAISAGTALHSGTLNLKGTVNTNQVATLSTTADDLYIPAGTAIGIDFTGVLTAAVGLFTVTLDPV